MPYDNSAAEAAGFTDAETGAENGVEKLVILLHGLNSDGATILKIGEALKGFYPNIRFAAPDATFDDGEGHGHRWFDPKVAGMGLTGQEFDASFEYVDRYIDFEISQCGVGNEDVILMGFDEGAVMALHVGLRREKQLGGIVSFAGALMSPSTFAKGIQSHPPVLLLHGDQDTVIPPVKMSQALEVLMRAGVPAESHMCQGTGHTIDKHGLELAAQFMTRVLKEAPKKQEGFVGKAVRLVKKGALFVEDKIFNSF